MNGKTILVTDRKESSDRAKKILDRCNIEHITILSDSTAGQLPYIIHSTGIYRGIEGVRSFVRIEKQY